jgi:Family of unknown function (DUF6470)
MNIPEIRIESTSGRIAISSQKPTQEIEQAAPELSISQPKGELTIETIHGRLSIDQLKAREDMDLKSIARRTEEAAELGYRDWLDGIARLSEQSDELMKIENRSNPLVEQARINSENPYYEFNIGFIPSANSVKIDYQPSKVKIDFKENKPVIEIKVNKPLHNYTPGGVLIEMDQWPSIRIEVAEHVIDEKK